jgi:hypothetical protein
MLLNFLILNKSYSIYRFNRDSVLPEQICESGFYSVTGTPDEISVVTESDSFFQDGILCSKPWKILKVCGPLDLTLTGILADITSILKENNIPVFTISTYDTDYFLVQERNLDAAVKSLSEKGHSVSLED